MTARLARRNLAALRPAPPAALHLADQPLQRRTVVIGAENPTLFDTPVGGTIIGDW